MKRFLLASTMCVLSFVFSGFNAYADPPPGHGYEKYYKGDNGYRGKGHYKNNNGYRGHWDNNNWNRNGYYWNGNNWVAPFVTGAIVGGVIAYALAPSPGVRYRQQQIFDPQCNCYRQAMVPIQ